ncbi:MAG: hypothetical protein QNK37_26900 [Acidobacteriota bacterium]|nr:hypothetical protein [Acidobacteriota bacterium]
MQDRIFDEWVQGKTCESCAIFEENVFCFVSGWSLMEDIEKSDVANFYLVHHWDETAEDGASKDIGVRFKVDSRRRLAVDPTGPEIVMAASGGNVFVHNDRGGTNEKMLSEDDIVISRNVRFIGNHFYIVGGIRRLLRRDGPEQWRDMTQDLRDPSLEPIETLDLGFDDVDGFNESDIYAVGGKGDAWRFDGQKWFNIDLPVNDQISCVCCASDGTVYIGGFDHLILRGREDQWEIVYRDDSNYMFHQIVEFDGRIFTVDEWGSTIYEITEDGVAEIDTGDFIFPPTSCLCMSVGHGMLLAAGLESASVFDGKTWRSVFGPEAEDLLIVQQMLDQANTDLGQILDGLE